MKRVWKFTIAQLERMPRRRQFCQAAAAGYEMTVVRYDRVAGQQKHEPQRDVLG